GPSCAAETRIASAASRRSGCGTDPSSEPCGPAARARRKSAATSARTCPRARCRVRSIVAGLARSSADPTEARRPRAHGASACRRPRSIRRGRRPAARRTRPRSTPAARRRGPASPDSIRCECPESCPGLARRRGQARAMQTTTRETDGFCAVSYNILANAYVEPDRYPLSTAADLEPVARRSRLLASLRELDADLYCLQEVEADAHADIAAALGPAFESVVALRPNRPDGCASFWRRDRFALEGHEVLHYRASDGHGSQQI